jgi:spectinomycin phosphotransferase
MLEKPPIPDEKLIACLRDSYDVTIASIEFLPLGYDSHAGVYRVVANDGQLYFLKVKADAVYEPGVIVARFLKDHGLDQVIAPLPTRTNTFWSTIDTFTVLLYPYIDGKEGMSVGLSDDQWIEVGAFLKKLHTTRLPPHIAEQVRKENFVPDPHWSGITKRLHAEIPNRDYDNPVEKELAAFWRSRHDEIGLIIKRAETLGRLLQKQPPDFVLCHADIHTANLLLTPDRQMFVVDWDQPVLAPKEQDLIFITVGDFVRDVHDEALAFQGYGHADINPVAMAYYRYARIVEDMGGFGEHVFLMDGASDESKQVSIQWFRLMFEPGYGVEVAHELADTLSILA